MRRSQVGVALVWLVSALALQAQQKASEPPKPAPKPNEDYSGMYAFLRVGEFVQLTVEDEGRVTGFVSRYGDLNSDRDAFLDHFFKTGKLEGNHLTFTTQTVHGVWFEFKGTIDRGEGRKPGDEAYYVLNGTLIEYATDANRKVTAKSRAVAFKQFPEDLTPGAAKRD